MQGLTPIIYDHNQYDKISDDLCYLGSNAILRMNVTLSRYSENYGRTHYHKEFQYNSKNNNDPLITIRRSFDYFLTIENLKQTDNGEKQYIKIGVNDILLLRDTLRKAIKWFNDKEFENLFVRSNGKIIMYGRPDPIYMSGLQMQKSLIFEPVVISFNEEYDIGVRIYLSSINNYVDLRLNHFMGFVYLIESINLYESAQILINYLQRPEFGTNLFSFSNDRDIVDDEVYNASLILEDNSQKLAELESKQEVAAEEQPAEVVEVSEPVEEKPAKKTTTKKSTKKAE